jgi:hypothetical protein
MQRFELIAFFRGLYEAHEVRDVEMSSLRSTEGRAALCFSSIGTQNLNCILKQSVMREWDRLCGLVVRVLGYRSGGPGSIPGTTRKK